MVSKPKLIVSWTNSLKCWNKFNYKPQTFKEQNGGPTKFILKPTTFQNQNGGRTKESDLLEDFVLKPKQDGGQRLSVGLKSLKMLEQS